jgi:hypothetical protein
MRMRIVDIINPAVVLLISGLGVFGVKCDLVVVPLQVASLPGSSETAG